MNERTEGIALLAGAVVLAIVFVMFGAGKFLDPAKWIDKFAAWGLPAWFVPVSGAVELAGAIGLLIPVVRAVAGLGLTLFMIGAVATHVVHAEIGMVFVAGAILLGSATVGWLRLAETVAWVRRRFADQPGVLSDRVT